MEMARKQTLLEKSKGHLTILQQEAKYKAEFLAADGFEELQKTPPKHLDSIAKNEYKRIINSLGNLPLRNLDRAELELYCTWYSIYKQCSLELRSLEDTEAIDKCVAKIDKATKNIKSLASDLGLTVNSRLQMNMPKQEKEGPKSLKERFG